MRIYGEIRGKNLRGWEEWEVDPPFARKKRRMGYPLACVEIEDFKNSGWATRQERKFVGERGGRLRRGGVHRGSFDFAQDRLFALERRAQDDSKNRQGRNAGVLRLRLAQRTRQTPLRMTALLVDRGRWTRIARRPTLAAMRLRRRWGTHLSQVPKSEAPGAPSLAGGGGVWLAVAGDAGWVEAGGSSGVPCGAGRDAGCCRRSGRWTRRCAVRCGWRRCPSRR